MTEKKDFMKVLNKMSFKFKFSSVIAASELLNSPTFVFVESDTVQYDQMQLRNGERFKFDIITEEDSLN